MSLDCICLFFINAFFVYQSYWIPNNFFLRTELNTPRFWTISQHLYLYSFWGCLQMHRKPSLKEKFTLITKTKSRWNPGSRHEAEWKHLKWGVTLGGCLLWKRVKKKLEMCNSGRVTRVWLYMVLETKSRARAKSPWHEGKLIRRLIKL